VIPVRSVGVQGDSRSYRPVLLLDEGPSEDVLPLASSLTNELTEINRVVAFVAARMPIEKMTVTRGFLSQDRLARLREADAIVRRISDESGFERQVWQFPVVLLPVGDGHAPDTVVLRPIHSVDGMTAQVVLMPPELLRQMAEELLNVEGVAAVFYDVTHKPPGTIEWE
jgi:GMP synthase (glutamine-hydrolysing)